MQTFAQKKNKQKNTPRAMANGTDSTSSADEEIRARSSP